MIKEIQNKDLFQLVDLCHKMHLCIDNEINEFGTINTIVHEINTNEDFIALGLYSKDKLIGFVKGYKFKKNCFYFSGIYVTIKNNKLTKQFIDYCFKFIKDRGYTSWCADATNNNIASILTKYGASVKYTRFIKEFD